MGSPNLRERPFSLRNNKTGNSFLTNRMHFNILNDIH